ncbi:sulfurtransferase FdhD [Methanocalculus taiwanensis]|uniref:Sulfurtransferase FdhD n=1 Tax=Methanocalculus taiwanensis TaxID=106207 RepID=A0ABD4TLN1_9EURY|nr:formate dehydrogenase accessory sulfurtransferase FdhD [Methanocalculus taiwanensis]MCQ1539109.1 sulfurtransferase FdhD [Methanocalculus taiwanensis]
MTHLDPASPVFVLLDDSECMGTEGSLLEETVVALFVNGRHADTTILSPGSLQAYVVGYLFSEEIIRSTDDIESIRIEKNRISVLTTNPFRITGRRKTILAGCGGSTSYIDTSSLPKIPGNRFVSLSAIRDHIASLSGEMESAALADQNGLIVSYRDIDCRCAVDRAIGHGLMKKVNFSETFLCISGRVTSEMIRRCLLAGIPILVSTGKATDLAVRIAVDRNLCLVSRISDGRIACLSHPGRIRGSS